VPQQRSDAQAFVALSQDPRMNGEKLLIRALQLYGVDQPEGYVKAPSSRSRRQVQGFLSQLGVPPRRSCSSSTSNSRAATAGADQAPGGPTVNGAQGAALGGEPQ
jgi:hypothetical protein